ncbi:MAG: molecular chaperone TorD family protein [Phycisphaeraceae bacterium]|nr:molecular chaperone TorD family protein [Phycisphaeraceae bacterium]
MNDENHQIVQCLAQADLLLWAAQWLRLPREDRPAPLDETDCTALLDAGGLCPAPLLTRALHAIEQARQETPISQWMREYHRLFEAAMACPVNEASYVRRDKGAILGDICGFYNAFGFHPSSDQGDRPDHLACELEFVALLLVMLAQAHERQESESLQVTRQAMEVFAADHLDAWLALFCEYLAATTTLPLYERLADLLHAAWEAIVQTLSLPRAAQPAADTPLAEPDSPYECGMADVAPVGLQVHGRPLPASPLPSS